MTQLLEPRSEPTTPGIGRPEPSAPGGPGGPGSGGPAGGAGPQRRIAFSRNLWLLIVAVAMATSAGITWLVTRSDDSGTTTPGTAPADVDTGDTQAEQIEQLTADLVTATARVATLTTEQADLDRQIADLEAELATTTTGTEALVAERDDLIAERDGLVEQLQAAEAEATSLEDRLDTVSTEAATLDDRLAILDVQVAQLLARAVDAEQQRDALIDLFPIEFDSSLVGVDLRGDWDLDWDEAFCQGFTTCGTTPAFDELTVTQTPEGWFRASADGVFDAALFSVEGALYTITQSATAAPACDGARRLAHVGVTLYAHGVTVLDDGSHRIEDLGATYVVEAPATDTCPAGVAFYSAELSPVG